MNILLILATMIHGALCVWEPLMRDNSSRIDALNTLGCIQASDPSVSFDVYIGRSNDLVLVPNEPLRRGSRVSRHAFRCLCYYGYNIMFSMEDPSPYTKRLRLLGDLDGVLERSEDFPEVSRLQPIGEFIMGEQNLEGDDDEDDDWDDYEEESQSETDDRDFSGNIRSFPMEPPTWSESDSGEEYERYTNIDYYRYAYQMESMLVSNMGILIGMSSK
ncbi:uncharacterized protein C5L36_0B09510 [Pichia kudriavzevii]|uniref:Uncharacterized protein n=2 Tax=Pichia kudriavzevii TaxID=4909 RepID=A0A2U9R311_PICKU|nr:uncharacterized protein C5L36_0B09510 [Pichia kudriavzevii]AWU75710.1 hypothetical protein C5L36_0B09510 [Pichia kudriavzevii]